MKRAEFQSIRQRRNNWILRWLVDLVALLLLLRLFFLWLIWALVLDSPLERFLFWKSSFLWLDWIGLGLVVAWLGLVAWRQWWWMVKAPRCPGCRGQLLSQADLVMASGRCACCGIQVIEDYARDPLLPGRQLTWQELVLAQAKSTLAMVLWMAVGCVGIVAMILNSGSLPDVFIIHWFLLLVLAGMAMVFSCLWLQGIFHRPCPHCGKPLGWTDGIRFTGHCCHCGCQVFVPELPTCQAKELLLTRPELATSWRRLVWTRRVTWGLGFATLVYVVALPVEIATGANDEVADLWWMGIFVWLILIGVWDYATAWRFGRQCPCCRRFLTLKMLPVALATGHCSRCRGQVVDDDVKIENGKLKMGNEELKMQDGGPPDLPEGT